MKKVFRIAIAAALSGSVSIASAQTTDKFSQLYSNTASVAPKFVKSQVTAKLQDALIARQNIRSLVLAHGKRVSEELISQLHGNLSGNAWALFILGIGGGEGQINGSIDQEVYKPLVDGGEFFVTAAIGDSFKAFIADVTNHAKQAGFQGCTATDEMAAKFDFDMIPQLKAQIARLRQDLDALETMTVAQTLPAREQTAYGELSKWAHNSKITVIELGMERHYAIKMPAKNPGDFHILLGTIGNDFDDGAKNAGLRNAPQEDGKGGWDISYYCNDTVTGFMQQMLTSTEQELWTY